MVVEGVYLIDVADGDVACRMAVDTHAARVLNGNFGMGLFHQGIAYHAAQLLPVLKGRVGNGQHTTQRGIVVIEPNHLLQQPDLFGVILDVKIFGLLVDYLTVLHGEGDVGDTVQLVLVLRNQDVVHHLVALQLRMGVPADNQVEPGEGFGHLDVVRVA